VSGYLYKNKGENKFEKVEQKDLKKIGLIKSAQWVNLNNDKFPDLIIAGEWMPIKIFINDKGNLKDMTNQYGLSNSTGMWNVIEAIDIEKDGDIDIIAGNMGENSFLKSNMRIYINDFDKNGSSEQIICYKLKNSFYPILDKDELINQIPALKKQLFYYEDYSNASIDQIFDKTLLKKSVIIDLQILESAIYINNNKIFEKISLPSEINYSPIFDIAVYDSNNKTSLLMGGNQYLVKPQFGRYDASKGWILDINVSNGEIMFKDLKSLNIEGQIRKFEIINTSNKNFLITAINDDEFRFFEIGN
jgi:hypothetical protein